MKSIDIKKTEKIYKLTTLHQVPDEYYVSGNPRFIFDVDDDFKEIVRHVKICLESSKKNYKGGDNDNLEEFEKLLLKRSGYKSFKKFNENSKNISIRMDKSHFHFKPYLYNLKLKSFRTDESKEIIKLPLSVDDETFFKAMNQALG